MKNCTTYDRQNPFPKIWKKIIFQSLILMIGCLFTWINLSRMLSGELEDSLSSRFIPSNERHRIFLILIMNNEMTVLLTVDPTGSF
jgi:hypothetical protein